MWSPGGALLTSRALVSLARAGAAGPVDDQPTPSSSVLLQSAPALVADRASRAGHSALSSLFRLAFATRVFAVTRVSRR